MDILPNHINKKLNLLQLLMTALIRNLIKLVEHLYETQYSVKRRYSSSPSLYEAQDLPAWHQPLDYS